MSSYLEKITSKHNEVVQKYGKKIASVTAKSFEVLEIGAGAAIAGVIQGREIAKGNLKGAHLFGLPADLFIGISLELAGHFGYGGEWSEDLCNLGAGFIAGYASDWGVSFGKRWIEEGHLPLLERKPVSQLPPPAQQVAAKGVVDPQAMADALANRLQPNG